MSFTVLVSGELSRKRKEECSESLLGISKDEMWAEF